MFFGFALWVFLRKILFWLLISSPSWVAFNSIHFVSGLVDSSPFGFLFGIAFEVFWRKWIFFLCWFLLWWFLVGSFTLWVVMQSICLGGLKICHRGLQISCFFYLDSSFIIIILIVLQFWMIHEVCVAPKKWHSLILEEPLENNLPWEPMKTMHISFSPTCASNSVMMWFDLGSSFLIFLSLNAVV